MSTSGLTMLCSAGLAQSESTLKAQELQSPKEGFGKT